MRCFRSLRLLVAVALCLLGSTTLVQGKIDITCDPAKDNHIDWDCVFGPDSLAEVDSKGGYMTSCSKRDYACSRYTHFGQLKGTIGKGKVKGVMIKGDPIFSLTANTDGLMVRFSNRGSTSNFHEGLEKHLKWADTTGLWVHVKIVTTFGESMEVTLSGAVEGKAVWPKHLKPVAWHKDADRVRMKLGLYHKIDEVHDGMVEYRDISIQGPNGVITTARDTDSAGHLYLGCFKDTFGKRALSGKKYVDAHMTTAMCADLCDGVKYFGLQYGNECWCSAPNDKPHRHGESSKCIMDCAGDDRRIKRCGGYLAMSVYERDGTPDDVPKGAKHVGCFADDPQDRALTLKSQSTSKMDYAACKKFCEGSKNSKYFGVQYGKECFCGSSKDDYNQHGPAICNMRCAGDDDLVCGGFGAMNVFKI
eukprot:g1543.t1